MKKVRFFIVLSLLAVCIAAVAAGCGSTSGTVIDKLPIDNNMPTQDGNSGAGSSGSNGGSHNQDNDENGNGEEPDNPETPPVNPPSETVENVVIFVAEDFEFTVPYSSGDTSVEEPAVPEKHGYSGKWQSYDLSQGGKITVTAEYELKNFTVTFIADGARTVKTYTVFDSEVEVPALPQKKGYSGVWENFELTYGAPVTVNAVYSLIYYIIYFPADGENISRTYTVLETKINEPAVPHKTGYSGEWSYGELTFGEDMFAEAVYTPLPATADGCFGWKLNENSDGYVITDYTGTESEVVIPPYYNNLPVTEIARSAFFNGFTESGLKGVIISENVQKIGNNAFAFCQNLTSVELPSTLREIGKDAFAYTAITEINLPENLVTIGSKAFNSSALTSVVIPDSVESLGEYAFMNCTSLKSAVTGNGLKVIKTQTFARCTALKTVVIGENVEEIEKAAFDGCTALESAVFLDTVYWNISKEGWQTSSPVTAEQINDPAQAAQLLYGAVETYLYKSEN